MAFPDPANVTESRDGIKVVNLPTLVELKLASGITGKDRLKDLADVQELIKLLSLSKEFGRQLNEYVRPKFNELWESSREVDRRYVRIWRNKWLTSDALSINDMVVNLRDAAELLEQMLSDGVILDPKGGTSDDYAYLVTTDPEVAKKYDMHDESEFFIEDEDDE